MNQLFSEKEINRRREAIFNQMEDFSICVLFSGIERKKSADATYPFEINTNFFYLTQIEQQDSILVLIKTPTEKTSYLFISPYDELKIKWTGKLLKQNEAKEISYIDNVLLNTLFEPKLDLFIRNIQSQHGNSCHLYLDLEEELKIKSRTTTIEFKDAILNRYDNLLIHDIYKNIIELRMVKTYEEIEKIKEAIATTRIGINKILTELKPDLYEYELIAEFEHELKKQGNSKIAFDTIAASGKNAVILHYPEGGSKINDGDLILFDLGAQFDHYCADISRTYPINGKFSEIQEKIYNEVLKANELVINSVMPGITIAELQNIAIQSLTKSLMDLGIINNPDDYIKHYYHGVSHHLGLDTHDPSNRMKPLEPGNVITVEPGLYIPDLGIGIRIEDDILVTNSGNMNLSILIPKSVRDIESLMRSRGK